MPEKKLIKCEECYFYGNCYKDVEATFTNGHKWCSEWGVWKSPNGYCDRAIAKDKQSKIENKGVLEDK